MVQGVEAGRAFAAGIAQLAFCSGWRSGLLVLLALGLVSEWMLAGAAVGAAIGTLQGRLLSAGDLRAWRHGIDGFNPAILGILGAGAFADFSTDLAWILAATIVVGAVDRAAWPWAVRLGLLDRKSVV